MKLPKKITPDPILNCVIEVRFNSSLPENAIFGTIHNKLKDNYPEYKNIGIPIEMKKNIPELKYSIDEEIYNDKYKIGIGSKAISFKMQLEYNGWEDFYQKFSSAFKSLADIDGLFDEIIRIGLRYINFFAFERNISNSFNLKIDFPNPESYEIDNTMYRTTLKKDDVNLTLRIEDKVKTINSDNGLLLDIDAFQIQDNNTLSKDNVIEIVNKLHKSEKQLFFGMLKDDFLNKFNPEFEN